MNNTKYFKDPSKPNFEPDQSNKNEIFSMRNLNNIAAEQLITVKAKIVNLSGVKVVPLANETLRKQEIDISDPTGTSKLLLWGENCEQSLDSGVTYIFSNFRLKVRGKSRYLNSPKMGDSSVTATDADQEEVQESFSPNMFYQEGTAELVEIESIYKYNSCPKCHQKMECSDMQILQCVCGATMKRKILSSNWVLKISCLKENGETLHLTMFTDCLKKLILEKSLESCVLKELSTYVLETIEEVKVQYDPDKRIVIDIERI